MTTVIMIIILDVEWLYARLGERTQARADLESSASLLPTAIAMNELGKLSLVDNDRTLAKQYFNQAAQAQGRVGQEASLSFTRLDLEDNPGNYISVQMFANDDGRIFGRVFNNSSIEVANTRIEFAAALGNRLGQQSRIVSSLPANSLCGCQHRYAFPGRTGVDRRTDAGKCDQRQYSIDKGKKIKEDG